ncbi:hypothetical protein CCAX7_56390 [Capsulimonas corticalis]|uniref:Uncharacterized protein n=1 Tax=Capsulimonas corticalis TaxID=2219043 RepID=A0A402D0K2_9BACT|nr:putative glycoside hydrolase [Capsulimonas corticalis]BDI33588.1 hypothetical protein CCAX7_56390 [Capsulimonas corticalis]
MHPTSRSFLTVFCLLGASLPALADPSARVEDGGAVVATDGYTATVSLSNARIELKTPGKTYHLKTSIIQDGAWVEPTAPAGAPAVHQDDKGTNVEIVYPVTGNRQFILDVSAYKDLPGIYLVSKLKSLGALHSDYFFWSWEGNGKTPEVPGAVGPVARETDPATYDRIGAYDWVYLPEDTGGLALFSKQTVGFGPSTDHMAFLNAIPNNQLIGGGSSLNMGMGLVSVQTPQEAADLLRKLRARKIPALNVGVDMPSLSAVNYGRPAPKWARGIDKYNCWPFASCAPKQWGDAEIKEWFADFPLVSHIPNDPAIIARLHKARRHAIMYINFMEMLDSVAQKAVGPKGEAYFKGNWEQIVDHENMDLSKHPNWIAYDKEGKARQSVWGAQANVPGLYNTCLHQADLQDAAIAQLKKVMALGVDGIFIDNAGPIQECYGDQFGKHTHSDGKTNTEMYNLLMQRVYKVVKSYGDDKIVILNSGITPDQWAYSDVQMWESCLYGSGVVAPTTEWPDAKYMGELQADAERHGKVPVILSYFLDQPAAVRSDRVLYTYAYARLYGMGWGDWYSAMGNECEKRASRDLYAVDLGKPQGKVLANGRAYSRMFEKGIALVNPERQPQTITIDTPRDGDLRDVCFDGTLTADGKKLTVTLRPQSGRVLLWK